MILLNNKRDLINFIKCQNENIKFFEEELNKNGVEGDYEFLVGQLDLIQDYLENKVISYTEDKQDKIRLGFWSFFSKMLLDKLGGELIIAPKSDYCAGTPLLINFGNKYDKKGKKKWVSVAFDSWFEVHIYKNALVSLKGKVEKLIDDYS